MGRDYARIALAGKRVITSQRLAGGGIGAKIRVNVVLECLLEASEHQDKTHTNEGKIVRLQIISRLSAQ